MRLFGATNQEDVLHWQNRGWSHLIVFSFKTNVQKTNIAREYTQNLMLRLRTFFNLRKNIYCGEEIYLIFLYKSLLRLFFGTIQLSPMSCQDTGWGLWKSRYNYIGIRLSLLTFSLMKQKSPFRHHGVWQY